MSARYCELPEEFYVPRPELIGVQSKSSKQARDLTGDTNIARHHRGGLCQRLRGLSQAAGMQDAARAGASVLPVATYSHMFATVEVMDQFGTTAIPSPGQYCSVSKS